MTGTAHACPRCGTVAGVGQEYCLACGLRLPGPGRLGRIPGDARRTRLRAALLALIAVAGGGVAIAATHDPAAAELVVTATGGSATVETPAVDPATRFAVWPRGRSGWTVVLVSVPKTDGRDKAVAVARQALDIGLTRVGVLDSSRFTSLQSGYWTVFAGVDGSEPEASADLRRARTVVRTARTQRIVPSYRP